MMLVAVVLSCGGNHAAEMAGGAAITVTPARPFKMAQMWLITVNVVSSSDTTLKVELGVKKGLERTTATFLTVDDVRGFVRRIELPLR